MSKFSNEFFPEYCSRDFSKWPVCQEIYDYFVDLNKDKPDLFTFREIGRSVEGRVILAAEISDAGISDENKQTAVFIAAEHGGERSATGTALELIKWLLSPEGKSTLKNQRILIVPVVNVDAYDTDGNLTNRNNINLFADYNYDGSKPEQPEAQAVWSLLEENKPDIFISMHGMSMDYDACAYHRTWESTAVAFTNNLERSYNKKIIDRINAAAEAEGYSMDLGAEDLERCLPFMPGYEYHSLPSFGHFAGSPSYCYNRFHSLSFVMEIGPVRSGFLRCREILAIGNECWEYECFSGYPNRIVTSACISTMVITAGGTTAYERRNNRCSLWQNSKNLTTGIGGRDATRIIGFVSKTKDDYTELPNYKNIGALLEYFETKDMSINKSLEVLEEEWKQVPLVWNDAKAVARIKERPNGKDFPEPSYDETLETGKNDMAACMRFRLDLEVEPERVLLNDEDIDEYRVWQDHRYKYLEVDLNPDWQRAVAVIKTTRRPQK